ncbi:MAG TPA: menaquinone biosynthesis protein [Pyrinomonadaceae bacterium]|nr:menaquinone biosynthesis protein [Pyrinomonadaceae bacterium]
MNTQTPRLAASSYSNTAPLIWSFLYGSNHGKVELVLDNAPSRSSELLEQGRVDAALVPVIASQFIDGINVVPSVCVGAKERVRSVCLVTQGKGPEEVRSVALDVSSRTSVVLTKIIFREFFGFEPKWRDATPNIDAMLSESDAALLIGDPALAISRFESGASDPYLKSSFPDLRTFDLAELWHRHTGLGFVFAMWMTRHKTLRIDLAAARDEGLVHIEEITGNYRGQLPLGDDEMKEYLTANISYEPDESMRKGMDLFFRLAEKNDLIPSVRSVSYLDQSIPD